MEHQLRNNSFLKSDKSGKSLEVQRVHIDWKCRCLNVFKPIKLDTEAYDNNLEANFEVNFLLHKERYLSLIHI